MKKEHEKKEHHMGGKGHGHKEHGMGKKMEGFGGKMGKAKMGKADIQGPHKG